MFYKYGYGVTDTDGMNPLSVRQPTGRPVPSILKEMTTIRNEDSYLWMKIINNNGFNAFIILISD
jgi:hypothetical protein